MKKIVFFIVLIASVFVINNLIRSIYTLWQKNDLIVDAQKELTRQKQENQSLKSEVSYAESKEFIEEVARNKLLMVKPGEQGVLIPQDLVQVIATSSAKENKNESNWRKWLKLFF